jgi:phenylalanyl-tRNA synthetase beta chain
MRISVDWLKTFVDVDLPVDKLIDALNSIGLVVDEWEEQGDDVVLDIETYANRPDTLGHLGVARELAAILGLPLKEQSWPLIELEEETSDLVDVQIWDEDLCPRYCGMIVKDIRVEASPEWLTKKIKAMGLNPVNNVVDVTNYVLFSTAHPIHAFYLAKIKGRKIIIRKARDGEILKSLEGMDVPLSPEMLVIADEKEPVALAGVIGGEESAVTERTRDVFIESAYFDPLSVRMTGKKAGIQTDASYRFEREADISFPPKAALMAASLLTKMGGKAARGLTDVFPKQRKQKAVVLRNHRVSKLLGVEIEAGFIEEILSNLGFQLSVQQQGVWQVKVPYFRIDIVREADLIEEIARFYGYEKIPAQIPPLRLLEPVSDRNKEKTDKVRSLLMHQGYDEVLNFSFMDVERESVFRSPGGSVEIRNPVSSRAALLRTSLLDSLLENVAWNRNRGAEGAHIFEIGKIYFWDKDESTKEQLRLGLAMTGSVGESHWREEKSPADFFRLKGTCEALLSHLRYSPLSFREEDHPHYREGQTLAIFVKGECIGHLGLISKEILESYGLEHPVWGAELNLNLLFQKQIRPFQYVPVSRYPSINRDISFLADRGIAFQEVKEEIERLKIPYVDSFDLSDRFSGASLPKGKESLTFRFVFRHPRRTMKAEEADTHQKKIIDALEARFNFKLREGGEIDK